MLMFIFFHITFFSLFIYLYIIIDAFILFFVLVLGDGKPYVEQLTLSGLKITIQLQRVRTSSYRQFMVLYKKNTDTERILSDQGYYHADDELLQLMGSSLQLLPLLAS